MNSIGPAKYARLLGKAAALHGHECPSLVYGCRLGLMALGLLPEGASPEAVTVHHSSGCLKDGLSVVMADRGINPESVSFVRSGPCSVEMDWAGGIARISVRESVRRKLDNLKRDLNLDAYRAAGVKYLDTLSDEDFADIRVRMRK